MPSYPEFPADIEHHYFVTGHSRPFFRHAFARAIVFSLSSPDRSFVTSTLSIKKNN